MDNDRIATGSVQVVAANLPRYKGTFTTYVGNPDGSSTCIGIECDHHHADYQDAKECGRLLAGRVRRHPERFPEVARAIDQAARERAEAER